MLLLIRPLCLVGPWQTSGGCDYEHGREWKLPGYGKHARSRRDAEGELELGIGLSQICRSLLLDRRIIARSGGRADVVNESTLFEKGGELEVAAVVGDEPCAPTVDCSAEALEFKGRVADAAHAAFQTAHETRTCFGPAHGRIEVVLRSRKTAACCFRGEAAYFS